MTHTALQFPINSPPQIAKLPLRAHITLPSMSPAARPPITCHVLDTTGGTPGAGIPVTLTLLSPFGTQGISYEGTTDQDGRVGGAAAWTARKVALDNRRVELLSLFEGVGPDSDMRWELRFDTGEYWRGKGVRPFFAEVKVGFVTRGFKGVAEAEREHWHVPVLLGPFSYTTYRGS